MSAAHPNLEGEQQSDHCHHECNQLSCLGFARDECLREQDLSATCAESRRVGSCRRPPRRALDRFRFSSSVARRFSLSAAADAGRSVSRDLQGVFQFRERPNGSGASAFSRSGAQGGVGSHAPAACRRRAPQITFGGDCEKGP
jgi:hypothetical protein